MKNKKKKNFGNLLASLMIFAFILVMVLAGENLATSNSNNNVVENAYKFSDGYTINGVNVGGLTQTEAEVIIGNVIAKKIDGMTMTLNYKDKSWVFTANDFETTNSAYNVVKTAYEYQAGQSFEIDPQIAVKMLQVKNTGFEVALKNVFVNFEDIIKSIIDEVEKAPVNSEVIFSSNTQNFEISRSESGIQVNQEKLYDDLEQQFNNTKNIVVEIQTKEVLPEFNEEFFKDKINLLSRFSTDVSTSKGGRKHNVTLALSKFNGKCIEAGQEISFNEITSPQNAEGGYQNATVIINGKFTEGVGGGICQASTTLYNALLGAGVEIKEVHKHTLPVGYVELGLDAMVTDGFADLKFKNVHQYPIYIKTYVDDSRCYVEVYGTNLKDNIRIKRRADFIKTLPHLGDSVIEDVNGDYKDEVYYKGQYFRLTQPREGYEVKAYLDYYDNTGKLIKSSMIRHEIYQPQKGLVVEGIHEVPEGTTITNDVEILNPASEDEQVQTTSTEAIQIEILKEFPINYNP